MRLICLIRGHRYHSLTRTCTRCHAPNELLMLVDAIAPAFNAVNRYLNHLNSDILNSDVKPTLEVLQTLTDEEQAMLEIARHIPRARASLPPKYAAMLDAEDEEAGELPYAP